MGEMRLIDANRVLEDLEDMKKEMDHPIFEKWKEYIDSIPIIDAEPVRHGMWEDVGDNPRDLAFRCSRCKIEYSWEVDMSRENYCPNCGAKMDKEEE